MESEAFPTRSEQFEHLYNELDAYLRTLLDPSIKKSGRYLSFSDVLRTVASSNLLVRNREDDLREFAELRNALVHQRGRRGIRHFAEPYPEVLEEFEAVVQAIRNPRRAEHLGTAQPFTFNAQDLLMTALQHMRAHDYSQVIVRSEKGLSLLTSVGITNWIERNTSEGIVLIGETTLSEALHHEPHGGYQIVGRKTVVDEVRSAFHTLPNQNLERVHAVIVTHSGISTETALRIITPWDIVDA